MLIRHRLGHAFPDEFTDESSDVELTKDRLDHRQGACRPTSWSYVAVSHARQGNEAEVGK